MSAYVVVTTKMTDAALIAAVCKDLWGDVEVHEKPQALFGYKGDKRKDTAEIIVRRNLLGSASNDLGFKRGPDGSYELIVSEFDRGALPQRLGLSDITALQNKIQHGYSSKKVEAQIARLGLRRLGQETLVDGSVRVQVQRRGG